MKVICEPIFCWSHMQCHADHTYTYILDFFFCSVLTGKYWLPDNY